MLGPGILLPLVAVAIVVPIGLLWARRRIRGGSVRDARGPRAVPLTSAALHRTVTAPWRVVHEIPEDRLGGVEHVLIGPPGVFALVSVLDALPEPDRDDQGRTDSDPQAVARIAMLRGDLDEVLTHCGAASDGVVFVHWGRSHTEAPEVPMVHGAVAVDGHRLGEWLDQRGGDRRLTPSQVDLAWRTVTTGVGRPDPLGDD